MNRNYDLPTPIIDGKEAEALDVLTKKYLQLIEPSKIAKIGTKASQLIPEKMKKMGKDIGLTISEQELQKIAPKVLENKIKKYLGGLSK